MPVVSDCTGQGVLHQIVSEYDRDIRERELLTYTQIQWGHGSTNKTVPNVISALCSTQDRTNYVPIVFGSGH